MILEVEEEAMPVKEVAVVVVEEAEEAKEAKGVAEEVAEEIPHLHPHQNLHRVQVLHAEEDGKEDAS